MADRFNRPGLYSVKARDLPLSGQALLDLMRAVLAKDRPFRFTARGWSMLPFIRDGDVITVTPQSGKLPGVGDVVAFVRPEDQRLVVHRVVARNSSGIFIQGDNGQGRVDGKIPPQNLLGRVTRIERQGHDVWLGNGPERFLIAWLSRTFLLARLRAGWAAWIRRISRR